jgi:hypothetical protein
MKIYEVTNQPPSKKILAQELSKIYEVKIMFGFKTDSDDALGILEKYDDKYNSYDSYDSYNSITKYKSFFIYDENKELNINQKFHHYSTKTLLSRSKNDFTDKYHNVKLYKSKIIDIGEIDYKDWSRECIETINKIDKTKNFRQQEIIAQWVELDNDNKIQTKIQYMKLVKKFIKQH